MNKVQEYIYNLLPPTKRRNDWFCWNCPVCLRQGEARPDTKKRGGIRFDGDGIVYHCFNCHFSWGWTPTIPLTHKMKVFLEDMGVSNTQMREIRLLIEEYMNVSGQDFQPRERIIREIPSKYKSINQSILDGENSKSLNDVYSYIINRNKNLLEWSNLMWAEGENNFLIPCYENNRVVGYSLRRLNDYVSNKYIHFIPQGYIYNYDNLFKDRKYAILCEGQLCADSISGVSFLSNEITPDRLNRLLQIKDKELIVVPDRDKSGKKVVEQILSNNLPFSVSFPNWQKGIKDIEENVRVQGRLYTLYDILKNKVSDKNKIKLKSISWFE